MQPAYINNVKELYI